MTKFKKSICLATTLCLSVGAMGGCKKNDETQNNSDTTVEVTVWPQTFAQNFTGGVQTDPVAKDILEKIGVKINLVETQPTNEKFAVMLASNSLPDLLRPSGVTIKDLIDANAIMDMEELINKKGPDIKANASKMLDFSKEFFSNKTNKLYCIQSGIKDVLDGEKPYEGAYTGAFLRWDYYKELGCPPIKSDDDFISIVEQMYKKHPKNEDGQQFVGFSPWFDDGVSTYCMYGSSIGGKSMQLKRMMEIDRKTAESKNVFLDADSEFWKGVKFFYKVNQKGLLDVDSFTQKTQNALEKGKSNRVLASLATWQTRETNQLLASQGMEERGFFDLVPVPFEGAKYYYMENQSIGNKMWCMNKNAKQPEKAMELLNYFYSVEGSRTSYNGIEGKDWIKENNNIKQTKEFVNTMKSDINWQLTTGATKYWEFGIAANFIDPNTKLPIRIYNKEEDKKNLSKVNKEICDYYKVDVPSEIAPPNAEVYTSDVPLITAVMPELESDMKRNVDGILNYLQSALPTAVLAKDDAEYEKNKATAIEKVRSMGAEEIYEYNLSEFIKAKEVAKKYLK